MPAMQPLQRNLTLRELKVVKTAFLKMCMNAELKAELQQAADGENRKLSNFIETHLRTIGAVPIGNCKCSRPQRCVRDTRLTMFMKTELKARLKELADADYRNLTDLVQTLFHEVVLSHRAKRKRPGRLPAVGAKHRLEPRSHVRTARLSARINGDLKDQLQRLAYEQHVTLTEFIEIELWKMLAVIKRRPNRPMLLRQTRDAHVGLRVSVQLKANLQGMAHEKSRTLTDFIEIELRRMLASHKTSHQV